VTDYPFEDLAALALQRKREADRAPSLSRDQGIAIIAVAMQRQQRKRALHRNLALTGAAITAVAASVTIWFSSSLGAPHRAIPSAIAARNVSNGACSGTGVCAGAATEKVDVAEANGKRFKPGSVLETPLGQPTEFALTSGTQLKLAGGTALDYNEGGIVHRFSLSRGHAEFSVVKQHAKERFLVNTPDSEIEVHGTVFEVALNDKPDDCGHRTQVAVSEGIVEVRTAGRRDFVTAGRSWPEGCRNSPVQQVAAATTHATPQRVETAVSVTPPTRTEPVAVVERARPVIEPILSSSDLAKQNELFARATRAMQTDQFGEAARLYGELNQTYPTGPLAESANAARLRALRLLRDNSAKK